MTAGRTWVLLSIAGTLGLLGLLRWLDLRPLTLPGTPLEEETAGAPPAARAQGDVLLLLRPAAAPPPSAFSAADFSCAWLNLLEAEFGAYSIAAEASALSSARPPRSVVVSSSAHALVSSADLLAFAARGGVVMIDGPDAGLHYLPEILEIAGARLGDPARLPFPGRGLLPQGAVTEEDRAAFDCVPFRRPDSIAHLVPQAQGARPGDSPLFLERAVGRGRILLAATCLARLYATMLQGAPAGDGFGLEEQLGDYPGIIEPDDLVGDARLRENELPYADLFARAVARLLDPTDGAAPPLPRLMWFPAGSRGAFLMTHDEDLTGGAAAREIVARGSRLGLRGTVFVVAHPRLAEDWLAAADYAAEVALLGGAVGLHWNQYPMPFGIAPIEPLARVMSCRSQAVRLAALSPAARPLATNRNHYLILRSGWARTFRILAAQGIRLDSTFAANKGRGYLFGTARPYRILDENGLPLPLRELPFVNQEDWGGADQAFFTRLLERNAERHRGAIVSLFHPHLVVQTEAGAALFEHSARTALATGHQPMNFRDLLAFWDARDRAVIRSAAAGADLSVEIAVERADFVLGFPVAADGEIPVEAFLDGQSAPLGQARVGGLDYALVSLPAGEHRLTLRWGAR